MKIIYGIVALAIVTTAAVFMTGSDLRSREARIEDVRTVVLTAKDMKFNTSNPTIAVAPGETIRIVVRNEDRGMKHDLYIPLLELRTRVLEFGEEAVLQFRAPSTGSLEYLCSFHPVSMRGLLAVADFPDMAGATQ